MDKSLNSYDIARMAGTSRSVVSLVINGKADQYRISRKTQERVLAAVKQTGYVPNMTIRNMFLNPREVIGVYGQTATLPDVIKPVIEAAGMKLETTTLSNEPKTAVKQISALIDRDMAVLLLPPAHSPTKGDKEKNGKHRHDDEAPDDLSQDDADTANDGLIEAPAPIAPVPGPAREKPHDKPDKPWKDKDQGTKHKLRHAFG